MIGGDSVKHQTNKQPEQTVAEAKAQAPAVDDCPVLIARAQFVNDRWERVQLDGAPWPTLH